MEIHRYIQDHTSAPSLFEFILFETLTGFVVINLE